MKSLSAIQHTAMQQSEFETCARRAMTTQDVAPVWSAFVNTEFFVVVTQKDAGTTTSDFRFSIFTDPQEQGQHFVIVSERLDLLSVRGGCDRAIKLSGAKLVEMLHPEIGIRIALADVVFRIPKALAQQIRQALQQAQSRAAVAANESTSFVDVFIKHASAGDATAQCELGLIYETGRGVPKDEQKALHWYRQAADQGNARAQYNIGVMHVNGTGVPQDHGQAMGWWLKAANQGHAEAQAAVGKLHLNGMGVAKNDQEAINWFRKAANQGHAETQFFMGLAYSQGMGVAQDAAAAVYWYRKASDRGYADAQVELGAHYLDGSGVPQDFESAYFWGLLSSAQGNQKAAQFRTKVAKFLTPQQIAGVTARADAWKPA